MLQNNYLIQQHRKLMSNSRGGPNDFHRISLIQANHKNKTTPQKSPQQILSLVNSRNNKNLSPICLNPRYNSLNTDS